jgi:peptidoglycan/LPS O-acetylase OafA/YrhL
VSVSVQQASNSPPSNSRPSDSQRNFGLDVPRAAAILMVLLSHMFGALELLGSYGVELFFVLSGFLIGGILIRSAASRDRFEGKDLIGFWTRRWFRTLPNYYWFLALYLVEWFARPIHGDSAPRGLLLYFVFLQNFFAWPYVCEGCFYAVTWSLTVEEWFYLAFPLAFYLLARQAQGTDAIFRRFRRATLLFLLVPPALRLLAAWFVPLLTPHATVILRLDSIMWGVMLAYVKTFHDSVWMRLRTAWPLGILGLVSGGMLIRGGSLMGHPFFAAQALLFTVLPPSLALILPVFHGFHRRAGWGARVIERISVWSYSMYLCHLLVYDETRAFLDYDHRSAAGRMLIRCVAVGLIFAVSALNYRYFERPLTHLRERFGSTKDK